MSVDLNKLHQYWYNHQEASGLDDTWSTLMLASYKPLLDEIDTLRSRVEELEKSEQEWKELSAQNKYDGMRWMEKADKLEAELARLRERLRWIPVGERLPEYGKAVLIKTTTSVVPRIGRHSPTIPQWATTDGLYFHGNEYKDVTHWMPLPIPPEVNNE